MASIIPGYNYDIFISYRQKDNKHDGWVTEFVHNLKDELESTFKEEISVYFDINPNDGLLETYDVDASLKEKLKCLIFIPIISRTYCDPKSFAWEHEFKAFVELASKDQFGLKVNLPNGNVAGRVLPVQIHSLDPGDKKMIEDVLEGHIRGIEFIYSEPGVNRPLKPVDREEKNLNKTKYDNQINKLGNAVKDFIGGMILPSINTVKNEIFVHDSGSVKRKIPYLIAAFIILSLFVAFLVIVPHGSRPPEKSIAVLPFTNLSNDPDQEHFCDGMTMTLLNNLFLIGGLEISSSSSSMAFKSSKLPLVEKANSLNVKYIIEGSVTKAGNNVRIFVNLLDGKDGRILWGHNYDTIVNVSNLLGIHSEIARQVADELSIRLNQSTKDRMIDGQTNNYAAYELYMKERSSTSFDERKALLEKAISLDPDFADAYARLALNYIWSGGHGQVFSREEVIEYAGPLIDKSLQIDDNSIVGHYARAYFKLYYFWDFDAVEQEYEIVKKLSPSNSDVLQFFIDFLLAKGEKKEALTILESTFERNRNDYDYWRQMALALYYNDQKEKAVEVIKEGFQLFPDDFMMLNTVRVCVYSGKWQDAIAIYKDNYKDSEQFLKIPFFTGLLGIAYFKTGEQQLADSCLQELLKSSEKSAMGSPSFFAAGVYTAMNEKDKALQLLEKAYQNREVEMYWLKVEPFFVPLHGNPDFESLLSKMKLN